MRLTRLTLILITGILALGFYRLITYLLDDLEFQTFQATEEAMVDAAHLLASHAESQLTGPELSEEALSSFDKTFDHVRQREFSAKIFVKEKTRVTLDCYLTDAQGVVVFDSKESRVGQDYSHWHDVAKTLEGGYGARSSRVIEEDPYSSIMFVGAPIMFGEQLVGVATVYKPQRDLLPFVKARRRQIMFPTMALAGAILFLIAAVLVWVYRPVGRLAEYARRITVGERPPFPRLGKGQEVNALGTALRDMREALEGRSYVETYTQTLTHELKSPLAAIRGAAELLDEEMPLEERSRFIANIRDEVDRSERLINRLLHLSALEGKTELEQREPIQLGQLLEDAARLIKNQTELRQVTLSLDLPPQDFVLDGDYYILRAAVENLLQNALDFSPEGSTIRLALHVEDEQAVITVSDEGPGLPDYALKRAFDRFYSLRPQDCANKGSGLGLSFVKEAALLHNGEAILTNLPQGGAKATLIVK
ncbi:MAG: two-component system sensor histidine kinase CreC [Verrucomicrobiota bacterium JB023]|nr:two-component system sensor histidine kinase CreC [Verrucomicrobiota bacterium JB023]